MDTNDGRRPSTAKRTVKAAAEIAVNGDVIRVAGGIYQENNPISLPQNVSVDGDDLRNTKIIPTNTGADLFHVDNGCLIQNCSFVGAANTGAMVAYHPPREVLNQFVSATSGAVHVSSWNGATLNVTGFDYSSKSGVATVTVGANHGLTAGVTQVGFKTDSISIKCSTDNFNSAKAYPRSGVDIYDGTLIGIAATTDTTFTSNIGVAGIGSEYVGFITQSPYVRNCTNFVPDSIGMQINGDRARGLKSMVVDSYTQYNENGIGVSITNNGYGQLVSIFTICPNIGIYCGSGGQCDLTNSNSSFGNKGLVAQGIGTVGYSAQLAANAIAEDNVFVLSGLGTFRPYSGQVLYVGELFQDVDSVTVTNAGSGYTLSLIHI